MPHVRTARRTGPRPFRSAIALAALLLIAPAMARATSDCASPVFSLPQTYGVGAGPSSVASGDFNGDGIKDLAVPNIVSSNVSVVLGDGAGNFTVKQFSVGNDSRFVAVGNFNGDNFADLALAVDDIPDELVIVFGNASGNFAAGQRIALDQSPIAILAHDFNGDGRDDLAVTVQHFEPSPLKVVFAKSIAFCFARR